MSIFSSLRILISSPLQLETRLGTNLLEVSMERGVGALKGLRRTSYAYHSIQLHPSYKDSSTQCGHIDMQQHLKSVHPHPSNTATRNLPQGAKKTKKIGKIKNRLHHPKTKQTRDGQVDT